MAQIVTNKHGLPDVFVNAVNKSKHKVSGDISVTQLIDAPQVRHLRKKNTVKVDVTDRLWVLIGSAVHYILESGIDGVEEALNLYRGAETLRQEKIKLLNAGEKDPALKASTTYASELAWITKMADDMEKYVKWKYPITRDPINLGEYHMTWDVEGWTISGTSDRIAPGRKNPAAKIIQDYKFMGTMGYMMGGSMSKYTAQLNVYASGLRKNGFEVEGAELILFFKDWSAMKALRERGYPKTPVVVIPIDIWEPEAADRYVENRVILHQQVEKTGVIPACTPDEMWEKPSIFRVKKVGGAKALNGGVQSSREAAEEFMKIEQQKLDEKKKGGDLFIDEQPGERTRCMRFCEVRDFCKQFKQHLIDQGVSEVPEAEEE